MSRQSRNDRRKYSKLKEMDYRFKNLRIHSTINVKRTTPEKNLEKKNLEYVVLHYAVANTSVSYLSKFYYSQ